MGDVINLQSNIERGGRYEENREDHVGTICEGIRTEKHIARQSASLYIQDKECMNKIKFRAILETAVIEYEI